MDPSPWRPLSNIPCWKSVQFPSPLQRLWASMTAGARSGVPATRILASSRSLTACSTALATESLQCATQSSRCSHRQNSGNQGVRHHLHMPLDGNTKSAGLGELPLRFSESHSP